MGKFVNASSLEHICRNGTVFKADRCDLKGGVKVSSSWEIDNLRLASDFAEFGAWHRSEIWAQLNGFGGYDNILYELEG